VVYLFANQLEQLFLVEHFLPGLRPGPRLGRSWGPMPHAAPSRACLARPGTHDLFIIR
jgi:hypothetical protein